MQHNIAIQLIRAAGCSASRVTVNAAFLREIKEINTALGNDIGRLERLAVCPDVIRRHARAFLRKLECLRDDLAMHFSLEEFFGYFEDPLTVAPRLGDRAGRLRDEHGLLYEQLCEIVDVAEELVEEHQLSRLSHHVPRRLQNFFDRLARHERDENELIMEAFCDDVGVAD